MLSSFETDLISERAMRAAPDTPPVEVNLGTLTYGDMGMAFIGVQNRMRDPAEVTQALEEFSNSCPGIYQFLLALDRKEKDALIEEGVMEAGSEAEGVMDPKIYAMFVALTAVRAATDVVNLKAQL